MAYLQYTIADRYGEEQVTGLNKNVKVRFDKYGIPHIKAKTDEDAYRALGFIMAGDRLFQMDLIRRAVNGILSEIFGSKLVKSDKNVKTT